MEDLTRHIKMRERNQKVAEMDFPQSIAEYRLKPKDTQHRAARFLVLESDEQREKMLSEFTWAWRQVTPLKEEFEANEVCFSLRLHFVLRFFRLIQFLAISQGISRRNSLDYCRAE
jgi:hypothetical protein